jgi:hypothetical protein
MLSGISCFHWQQSLYIVIGTLVAFYFVLYLVVIDSLSGKKGLAVLTVVVMVVEKGARQLEQSPLNGILGALVCELE